MDIGKKLKRQRLKQGYTQQEAAEKMYVTRQTISNWENEKSYPDLQSVVRLSDLYKISLDELLKGEGNIVSKVSNEERKKGIWIGIIPILLVFYVFPLLLLGNEDGGGEIVVLGLLTPVSLFILNILYAFFFKFTWKFALMSSLLFIPVIFIYFNYTALSYVLVFIIISIIGNAIGGFIDNQINKQKV